MNKHFQRGVVLFQQNRFQLAEAELRQHLAQNPDHAQGHAMLAFCLNELEQKEAAIAEAKQAIQLAPNQAHCHYALAYILNHQGQLREAARIIRQAIQLNPADASFYELFGRIQLKQGFFEQALASLEQGLKLEPEHIECANLRALALKHLGRTAESSSTLKAALARDPENPYTHTNWGWFLLETSQPQQALTHFKEALRLNPESEWAREGIVTTLKSHNKLYRFILQYTLWANRLEEKSMWLSLFIAYTVLLIVWTIIQAIPISAYCLLPAVVLSCIFVYLMWIADTFFNFLLRLDSSARFTLSESEVTATNWAITAWSIALITLLLGATISNTTLLGSSVLAFLMVIPISQLFSAHPQGNVRPFLKWCTVGLLCLGVATLAFNAVGSEAAILLGVLFVVGLIVLKKVASYLIVYGK